MQVLSWLQCLSHYVCLQACLGAQKAVLFTGTTGVGKTVILAGALERLRSNMTLVPFTINFSAQTQAFDTQVCPSTTQHLT